jgi:hypothetical protein
MDKFIPCTPTETKQQSIDWDKVELPIWYKDTSGAIVKIDIIDKEFISGYVIQESIIITEFTHIYKDVDERNQYLNKIEFLPKGTKITIEL